MQKIIKLIDAKKEVKKRLRVCAYARVSRDKEEMFKSLSNQVSYYNKYISSNPKWEFIGIYADYGLSGTKEDRPELIRMLNDCKDNKIDLIITKSISRLARNIELLLQIIRTLKNYNVDIFFEEQNLHTFSKDGEMILSLFGAFYQEEAKSVSDNMKWRVKKNFENGMPWSTTMLGYRYDGKKLVIEQEEAKTVRFIFDCYLKEKSLCKVAKALMDDDKKTRLGNKYWSSSTVKQILNNYAYTGNLILQTTYRENFITKRTKKNKGQLPKYHIEDSHEAIISLDEWNKVQLILKTQAAKYNSIHKNIRYLLTGMIKCGICGMTYQKVHGYKNRVIWICPTFNKLGKKYCNSQQIRDDILIDIIKKELNLNELNTAFIKKKIKTINSYPNNKLIIDFTDDTSKEIIWHQRSRSSSWTMEMKEEARKRALEYNRSIKKGDINNG